MEWDGMVHFTSILFQTPTHRPSSLMAEIRGDEQCGVRTLELPHRFWPRQMQIETGLNSETDRRSRLYQIWA